MLPVKIAGLGCYLPERRVTNAELEERFGIPADWIERATGVRERRYATGETTLSMGACASRAALRAAGLDASELDLIVGACTAPHQAIPCTAALAQRELGAREGASACFDLNATCMSFLFALHIVSQLIAGGSFAPPSFSAANSPRARSTRASARAPCSLAMPRRQPW